MELKNFNNSEVRRAINYVSTRRSSLEKYLARTLMQWDTLESYFLSNSNLDDDPTVKDPDEKPSREKWLVNAFKQPVNKLYSMFVQSAIPVFDRCFNVLKDFDSVIMRTMTKQYASDIIRTATSLEHLNTKNSWKKLELFSLNVPSTWRNQCQC